MWPPLEASTTESRLPWIALATILSVTPFTYMSAVSMKLTPRSSARAMMASEVASSTCLPIVMVPRHRAETFRPVRPSLRYCMSRRLLREHFRPGGDRPVLPEQLLDRRLGFRAERFGVRDHHLHALALQVEQVPQLARLHLLVGPVCRLFRRLHHQVL